MNEQTISQEHEHKPTKEQVRNYLQKRQCERRPPPSLIEIRRRLGWELTAALRPSLR